uniref:Uncharacterized protein n=1 Tax=Anguilla anguilla TaxID=7936 RepID=A0A0E9QDD6_ANGAN
MLKNELIDSCYGKFHVLYSHIIHHKNVSDARGNAFLDSKLKRVGFHPHSKSI